MNSMTRVPKMWHFVCVCYPVSWNNLHSETSHSRIYVPGGSFYEGEEGDTRFFFLGEVQGELACIGSYINN